jgi:hypothetical protein
MTFDLISKALCRFEHLAGPSATQSTMYMTGELRCSP